MRAFRAILFPFPFSLSIASDIQAWIDINLCLEDIEAQESSLVYSRDRSIDEKTIGRLKRWMFH